MLDIPKSIFYPHNYSFQCQDKLGQKNAQQIFCLCCLVQALILLAMFHEPRIWALMTSITATWKFLCNSKNFVKHNNLLPSYIYDYNQWDIKSHYFLSSAVKFEPLYVDIKLIFREISFSGVIHFADKALHI